MSSRHTLGFRVTTLLVIFSLLAVIILMVTDSISLELYDDDEKKHHVTHAIPVSLPSMDVCFSPDASCAKVLVDEFDRANKTIHVMIYIFSLDDVSDALIRAWNRGVDVKVVLDNSSLDETWSEYFKLVKAGIDLRVDERQGIMHDKTAIIDSRIVLTGSYNWGIAADTENRENLVTLQDKGLAVAFEKNFAMIWANSSSYPMIRTANVMLSEKTGTQLFDTGIVLINEVEFNPDGGDEGNEWVDLYNPTPSPIDIGGYTIEPNHTKAFILKIPDGTMLAAKGFAVVSYSTLWLDNDGESVLLKDANGQQLDETPVLIDIQNDNRSWQRVLGQDINQTSDWQFKHITKGDVNIEQ